MGCLLGRDAAAYLSTALRSPTAPVCPPPYVPYMGYCSHGEGRRHSGTNHDDNGRVIHIMDSGMKGFRRRPSTRRKRSEIFAPVSLMVSPPL